MLGFIIGGACLVGLFSVIRRGRRGRHHGYGRHGHHCGHRGWHGDHDGEGRRGRSRGGMLYRLFEHLDTTPGQEKAIREAFEEFRDTARGTKKELGASREDIARALKSELFDETLVGDMFARQDDSVREIQKAFAGVLAKVHDALDEKQRARLAELIASGPGFGGFGPYRSFI